jgi:molecular chaperone IbpA
VQPLLSQGRKAWCIGCRIGIRRSHFHVAPEEDVARSTVGFDRLFDLLDQSARADSQPNWPPYNIERTGEDDYRITMALAGFSPNEVELVQKENTLFVAGHKNSEQEQNTEVLHRGIATRSFRQSFNLAEHVKVTGARFENGL